VSARDLSELSMLELFRLEAESQMQVLTNGLLALERNPTAAEPLEVCMRAAHSLKGAARIVGLDVGVSVMHAMEDCFVAAQRGAISLRQPQIDVLLQGVDLLNRVANTPDAELAAWTGSKESDVGGLLEALTAVLKGRLETEPAAVTVAAPLAAVTVAAPPVVVVPESQPSSVAEEHDGAERVLRVTANNLNRLLGLAGESMVESRWLKPFAESMLRLKRLHDEVGKTLEGLREVLSKQASHSRSETLLVDAQHRLHQCRQALSQRFTEIEMFDSRSANLAHRLYDAALACRMRPFADGVRAFPRMVRDLGRSLGKQVRLEIIGEATQVDRDILEKLDAPLGHLLRNAIDHGIESTDERRAVGKAEEGVVRLEARHSAGLLQIITADDGRGIDLDKLRTAVVERKLTTVEMAGKLSEAELLEFLFLPGFTLKETVTEISGRGVGLDVVQDMIKEVRGTIRVFSQPGKGARFQLQLPLTLSVVRTLLVEIGGEAYAFPLHHIVRTLKLPKREINVLEGRQYFQFEGRSIGLVSAHQVLGGSEPKSVGEDLAVIIVGESGKAYGLVMDRFLGERELVVQPLDGRLGKIKDIAAGALMEDGSPVLIVDVEDLLRSVEKLVAVGRLDKVQRGADGSQGKARKRVLVVDDSLTVRELERKLLDHGGYEVEIAVDGMDGWNAVRTGHFNLVVTDVDMPRMDGIQLVNLIKKDPNLKSLPVMIVSYKDRQEDRRRGLEAGADYYLTKGSFHDETLLQAVVDLIGAAQA
jgi:two-component system sensor histidine kinase and response regulator WspE